MKKKGNDYLNESLAIIDAIYVYAKLFRLTNKKRTWSDDTYHSYQKNINSLARWIDETIIPRLLLHNATLPVAEQKKEHDIRKQVLPFYWETKWIKEFFEEKIEAYHEDKIVAKTVINYIHRFNAFHVFYRDLAKMQVPLEIAFQLENGQERKKTVVLKGKRRMGADTDYFKRCELNDVIHSDKFAHGLKITRDVAFDMINNHIPKSKNNGGKYNDWISKIAKMQLLAGGRLQFTLKLTKRDFVWFDKQDYITLPEPLNESIVGTLTFDKAKGGLARTVFLTEEFKDHFYEDWQKLKKPTSKFFNILCVKEGNYEYIDAEGKVCSKQVKKNEPLSDEQIMRMVQKTINEASKIGGYTSDSGDNRDIVKEYVKVKKMKIVGEKRDEQGNITKKGLRVPVTVWDDELNDYRELVETKMVERKVRYSINSHSFRKCYGGFWFWRFHMVAKHGLKTGQDKIEEMIDIHKQYQTKRSVHDMEKRIHVQYKRLNNHVFERIETNRKRKKEGKPLLPKLTFIDWNHVNKTELLVSLLMGHTRYEVVSTFYVDIPEEIKLSAKRTNQKKD